MSNASVISNTTSAANQTYCLEVSELCPVKLSTYGYYPNLGANAFFLAVFAICMISSFASSLHYRTWTYMVALTLGCLTEFIGYIGRIMLHNNPFDGNGFEMQICCLIIAPAFISAGIYLTLKHIVLCFGTEYSVLRPRSYTWIFICFDIISLLLQAAGGGIAASASDESGLKLGNDIMMAGIVWQVITLTAFAALAGLYYMRLRASQAILSSEADALRRATLFKLFLFGMTIAFVTIYIRCVYRIAEMAGGWGNKIMKDEVSFIVLDGVMISISVLFMTAFHPGYCFPPLSSRYQKLERPESEARHFANTVELQDRDPK